MTPARHQRPARPARRGGAPAWWLVLALTVPLAACLDGYPSDDLPTPDPFSMAPAELLGALNELGAKALPGHRWRYSQPQACALKVKTGRWPWSRQVQQHRLEATQVTLVSTPGSRLHQLALVASPATTGAGPDSGSGLGAGPDAGTAAPAGALAADPVLLQTAAQRDAQRAQLLLQMLQRHCNQQPA